MTRTQERITEEFDRIRDIVLEKNQAYGDSALDPVRIFSRADPVEQIRVRLDDKLSRLVRGRAAGEDVTADLIGYLILLRIAENPDEEIETDPVVPEAPPEPPVAPPEPPGWREASEKYRAFVRECVDAAREPLQVGDRVRRILCPRVTGEVTATDNGSGVQVSWDGGQVSYPDIDSLERDPGPDPVQTQLIKPHDLEVLERGEKSIRPAETISRDENLAGDA